jgi:hypothetical protein
MKRKDNHSPYLSEEEMNKLVKEISDSKTNKSKAKKPLTILPTNQLLQQV